MATLIKDWREMRNGTGKRHAYYASREWAVLKEAVKERSGGVCERCKKAPGESVHHQTYERLYAETLEDLLHTCGPCHEFVSGKSKDDPAAVPAFTFFGNPIKTVVLIGEFENDLIHGLAASSHLTGGRYPNILGCNIEQDMAHRHMDWLRGAVAKCDFVFGWFDPFRHRQTLIELGIAEGVARSARPSPHIVMGHLAGLTDDDCFWLIHGISPITIDAECPLRAWKKLWHAPEFR